MKVYLVRHGKAQPTGVDPSNPLTVEGRSEISHLARTLRNLNLKVTGIVHSGKLRAEETAGIIADSVNPPQGVRVVKGLAPQDDISEAMEMIETFEQELMIVGHLPFLENLLAALVKPAENEVLPSFDNGTLVGVEKTGEAWQIFRHLGPRMIQ